MTARFLEWLRERLVTKEKSGRRGIQMNTNEERAGVGYRSDSVWHELDLWQYI